MRTHAAHRRMGSSNPSDKHTKRKHPPDGLSQPSAKKSNNSEHKSRGSGATDGHDVLREKHKHAVSALYTAYERLSGSQRDPDADAAAFQALLDGAKGALPALASVGYIPEASRSADCASVCCAAA